MTSQFDLYQSPQAPRSPPNLCWNLYGAGIENFGRDHAPESCPLPVPGPSQLLVRVDAVGLCLSDIKLVQQGGQHPKLYQRDLSVEPIRLGHEVSLTIMQVGAKLQSRYSAGQRFVIQPDIYHAGRSSAYGYTIPGGLIRFHLLGEEVLDGDGGNYLLPVPPELGYAEAALTEPWACVAAAYTQRRRLSPKPGGKMWLLGHPGDPANYQFSSGMELPSMVVATDLPTGLLELIQLKQSSHAGKLVIRDGLAPDEYPRLKLEFASGFDDIIVIDPRSSQKITAAADLLNPRATFNLVGQTPLDGDPEIDLGRIHYDYTAFLGTLGPDIASAYGEGRNRCELRPGGTAVFVGAGGPMGQMHVQRALEMPSAPSTILVTELNRVRLEALRDRFLPLADRRNIRLLLSSSTDEPLSEFVLRETHHKGADDAVVCVPSARVMAEAARSLNPDGMLVLFAGVPIGTYAPLNMSNVYLNHAQYTGTSGSAITDQLSILQSAQAGQLSPGNSVAAIGGMDAARDGILALMEGRFPGKVVIFPQLGDLPLVGLSELETLAPHVAACLTTDGSWSRQAEAELIGAYWKP